MSLSLHATFGQCHESGLGQRRGRLGRRFGRMTLRSLILLLAIGSPAQIAAQSEPTSAGFIDVRYATHTSLTLYAGFNVGTTLLIAGMVRNPRSDYSEIVGGVARDVGARTSARVAIAGAYASDGWYAQLYVLPSTTVGPVKLSGLLLGYLPLDSRGARQFYVNPLSAAVPVSGRLALGGSYTLGTQAGLAAVQRAGPMLQLATSRFTMNAILLGGINGAADELRVGFFSSR